MQKNKGKILLWILQALLITIWGIACFRFFQVNFRYHFFFVEQNQLFMPTPDCLALYFHKPAWLACMAGDWVQQFYHFEYAGAALLALSLVAFGLGFHFALREALNSKKAFVSLITTVLAIVAMTLEARLFFYENARLSTLYAPAGGILLWIAFHKATRALNCRKLSGNAIQAILFTACALLCWWCFGYGVLAFLLFELLNSIFSLRIPGGVLASVVLALCIAGPICSHYRMEKKQAVLYPGIGKWVDATKAKGVEDLLEYDIEYSRRNYRKIITLYEHSRNAKTPEMSFYYSASASQLGILPDKLLKMKKPFLGTFIHLDSKSNLFSIEMAGELYYLIGDMTYTERACMHANNFSPTKRCARLIKRLAEANLVSGDYDAAATYLNMLKKSFIYRKWAEEHTPGQFSEEFQKEIEYKRAFLNTTSEFHIGDNCHTILCGLLDSNRNNIIALDYLLCTDIIANQKGMFMRDYEKYGPRDCALYNRIVK